MARLTAAEAKRIRWWQEARFGMFIHWGIYTATDLDCWTMHGMGIPTAEYIDRFEPKFTGRNFDADALMRRAKDTGFKYVVMGARHHEGYSLWDTDTTSFSSAKMTPKRDFIGEYVKAARKHGLGVGIYYSTMDWRSPGFWAGPKKDPKRWKQFVEKVHEQVRELMTRYGKIDILWYDGNAPPHWKHWGFEPKRETPMISKEGAGYWRAEELDRKVRRWQPGILINNRLWLKGDFGTPEQILIPEARPWEMCDTIGDLWGYSSPDLDRKTARRLIYTLIRCVSSGGNLLLNVGPRTDGTIAPWQARILEQIGRWLKKHGEAIYGCGGVWDSPLSGGLGPWKGVRKGDAVYLHLLRYPGETFSVATLHDYHFISAELLDTGKALKIRHEPTRDMISGLPAKSPDNICSVVKVKFRKATAAERKKRKLVHLATEDECWR